MSVITQLHLQPTILAKEDIDIDLLGRLTSALALNLCPEGIERCECANKENTFTTGPFNFTADPIGVSLEQLTCAPDFCYCKARLKLILEILRG